MLTSFARQVGVAVLLSAPIANAQVGMIVPSGPSLFIGVVMDLVRVTYDCSRQYPDLTEPAAQTFESLKKNNRRHLSEQNWNDLKSRARALVRSISKQRAVAECQTIIARLQNFDVDSVMDEVLAETLNESEIAKLRAQKREALPWIGLRLVPDPEPTDEPPAIRDRNSDRKAVVDHIEPVPPAAVAGIQTGDEIVSFGGKPIHRKSDLTVAVLSTQPGVPVPVEIVREGKRITLQITPMPERPQ